MRFTTVRISDQQFVYIYTIRVLRDTLYLYLVNLLKIFYLKEFFARI